MLIFLGNNLFSQGVRAAFLNLICVHKHVDKDHKNWIELEAYYLT